MSKIRDEVKTELSNVKKGSVAYQNTNLRLIIEKILDTDVATNLKFGDIDKDDPNLALITSQVVVSQVKQLKDDLTTNLQKITIEYLDTSLNPPIKKQITLGEFISNVSALPQTLGTTNTITLKNQLTDELLSNFTYTDEPNDVSNNYLVANALDKYIFGFEAIKEIIGQTQLRFINDTSLNSIWFKNLLLAKSKSDIQSSSTSAVVTLAMLKEILTIQKRGTNDQLEDYKIIDQIGLNKQTSLIDFANYAQNNTKTFDDDLVTIQTAIKIVEKLDALTSDVFKLVTILGEILFLTDQTKPHDNVTNPYVESFGELYSATTHGTDISSAQVLFRIPDQTVKNIPFVLAEGKTYDLIFQHHNKSSGTDIIESGGHKLEEVLKLIDVTKLVDADWKELDVNHITHSNKSWDTEWAFVKINLGGDDLYYLAGRLKAGSSATDIAEFKDLFTNGNTDFFYYTLHGIQTSSASIDSSDLLVKSKAAIDQAVIDIQTRYDLKSQLPFKGMIIGAISKPANTISKETYKFTFDDGTTTLVNIEEQ